MKHKAQSIQGENRPPFFIVGTGRCGSSLLRRLIATNPQVYVPQETHWLPILHNQFGQRTVALDELFNVVDAIYMAKGRTAWERIVRAEGMDDTELRAGVRDGVVDPARCTVSEFMEAVYGAVGRHRAKPLVGDKTPDYGLCMEVIDSYWPLAKFVHIYRDGREAAVSMFRLLSFRLLAAAGINHWWALAYRKAYEPYLAAALSEMPIEPFYVLWRSRFLRIRDAARRLGPGRCLEVNYADLLADPARTLCDVAAFLDLGAERDWVGPAVATIRRNNRDKYTDPDAEEPDSAEQEVQERPGRIQRLLRIAGARRVSEKTQYDVLTERFHDDLRGFGFLS